jgi:hypothetical protein
MKSQQRKHNNEEKMPSSLTSDVVENKRLICCAQYRAVDVVNAAFEHMRIMKDVPADAKCWHCTYAFPGDPWHIPKTLTAIAGAPTSSLSTSYSGFGHFCSPSCAASWVNGKTPYYIPEVMMFLNHEAAERGVAEFAMAPPQHWLVDYGGAYTIDEFRELGSSATQMFEKTVPFVSIPLVLERAVQNTTMPSSKAACVSEGGEAIPRAIVVKTRTSCTAAKKKTTTSTAASAASAARAAPSAVREHRAPVRINQLP